MIPTLSDQVISLHYRCFFQLSEGAWEDILQEEVNPFNSWEYYFGEPFKHIPLKPDQLEELKTVSRLYLSDCGISDLSFIDSFSSLQFLDISFNPLDLSEQNKLQNIPEINCAACELTNRDLSFIRQVRSLNIRKNDIGSVIQLLLQNPELHTLYADMNYIKQLADLPFAPNIKQFGCSRNLLTDISGLCNFPNLENLYLHNNLIKNLDVLYQLAHLKIISIADNDFSSEDLKKLTTELQKRGVIIEETEDYNI